MRKETWKASLCMSCDFLLQPEMKFYGRLFVRIEKTLSFHLQPQSPLLHKFDVSRNEMFYFPSLTWCSILFISFRFVGKWCEELTRQSSQLETFLNVKICLKRKSSLKFWKLVWIWRNFIFKADFASWFIAFLVLDLNLKQRYWQTPPRYPIILFLSYLKMPRDYKITSSANNLKFFC